MPWEPSTLSQQPFPNRAENSWERQDSSLPTRDILYLPCSMFRVYPLLGHTPLGWVRLTKIGVRGLADTMTDVRASSPEQHQSVPSQHRWSVLHFINLPCWTTHKTVFLRQNKQKMQRKHILNFFLHRGSLLPHSLNQLHPRARRNFCVDHIVEN